MARLHEQLRYFVKMKMSSDPLWSKVKVILSGHEVICLNYLFLNITHYDNVASIIRVIFFTQISTLLELHIQRVQTNRTAGEMA